MTQQLQSRFAMPLMTVPALIVTAWASSAVADLPEEGGIYEVFRSEKRVEGHPGAFIIVVKTQDEPVAYSLVFLPTKGPERGRGFVCGKSGPDGKGAHSCSKKINGIEEIVTVGTIDSEFCKKLRVKLHDSGRRTADNKNPVVADSNECQSESGNPDCVCFDIVHIPPDQKDLLLLAPPNSGSGTGGHN